MANSDDLSAETTAAAPPRKQFRLTGPSIPLEPGRYAVRRDLAEIAVADRIFAQHFVEPMAVTLKSSTDVLTRPGLGNEVIATLAADEVFLVVDLGHQWAWGRGERLGTVGYVAASVLDMA